MEYQIALSPDLALSPADFVAAWNEDRASQQVAEAHLSSSSGAKYDPALVDGAIAVLSVVGNVGLGVITNAIYDVLKLVMVKHGGGHKHTHIMEVKKPDGTSILVIDIDE